ncbi:MAG TPA: hypothetical protein VIV60_21815 [Polyangiaceae bacterium]
MSIRDSVEGSVSIHCQVAAHAGTHRVPAKRHGSSPAYLARHQAALLQLVFVAAACTACGSPIGEIPGYCQIGAINSAGPCYGGATSATGGTATAVGGSVGEAGGDPASSADGGAAGSNRGGDAGSTAQTCGNGVVESPEVCDDGNLQTGDGCSATCEPDDNMSTRGDDRAGYVQCPYSSANLCGPGTYCCYGSGCVNDRSECHGEMYIVECDGPEDCLQGEICISEPKNWPKCSPNLSSQFAICRTDADCTNTDGRTHCSSFCY